MRSETAETIIPSTVESTDRRKSLLQAAFDVIAMSGFEGLRTRAVAQRAGVNIATLHYYFPSKQHLIEGLGEFLTGIFMTLHAPAPPSTGFPAVDHLRQEFIDGRYYQDKYPELQIVLEEFALRARRDPGVASAVNTMLASWRSWIGSIVRLGIAEGSFRSDLEPEQTIATLQAVMGGRTLLPISELDNIQRGVEAWLLTPEIQKTLNQKPQGVQS
jgi:TetR/AcrR family transcriptional regulator, regulator of cefoperazone and chloramphenicol sensitivity